MPWRFFLVWTRPNLIVIQRVATLAASILSADLRELNGWFEQLPRRKACDQNKNFKTPLFGYCQAYG
jgi:hypothetical protein